MKKSEREQVVDLLTKINSEGLTYYFESYSSAGSLKRQYPFLHDDELPRAAHAFEAALDDLKDQIQQLKDKYAIDEEEVMV